MAATLPLIIAGVIMAVAEKTYTDPTAQMLQALLTLGGTKESVSSSSSIDPAALAGLQQILGTQMQGTTVEGSADLLKAIFSKGMEQVPGLATTYAQAAGARTTGNSPLQLAMQDLMVKLTQEGARQLSTNQVNAANTAGKLADSSRTETKTGTKTPKASALQLLPFALANAGKLKGLIDGASGLFSGSGFGSTAGSGVGSFGNTPFNYGNPSYNFTPSVDFSGAGSDALAGALDFGGGGFDFGTAADSGADIFGFDYGGGFGSDVASGAFDTMGTEFLEGGFLGFEEGGLVDKKKYVNIAAERAFDSGGDEKESGKGSPARTRDGDFDFFRKPGVKEAENAILPADKKREDSLNVRIMKRLGFEDGGLATRKAPGYANGGSVRRSSLDDVASTDQFSNRFDKSGRAVRGITYNEAGDYFDLMRGISGTAGTLSRARTANRGTSANLRRDREESTYDQGSSEGAGMATGQVGTVAQNEAAINGFVGQVAAAVTGVPGLAISGIMTALGIPNTPISPISPLMGLISQAMGLGGPGEAGVAPEGTGGFSSVGDNGAPVSSSATSTTGLGVTGLGSTMGSTPESIGLGGINAEGGGGGTSDGGAVGDAASAGVGGGGFSRGGEVDGPKGRDVIPAYLTDNEYVIKADVVKKLGVPFFDALNSMFDEEMTAPRGKMVQR